MDASRNSCAKSSESMGMFGTKHFKSIKTEEELRYGLEGLCRSESTSGNSAIIEQEETDPTVN